MRRACKVMLKFANARKRAAIVALLCRYRAAVNFYIRSLWETPGKLDAATLARLHVTELSARYKSQALKQALEIVLATKKSAKALGKRAKCPVFRGSAILDAKFVSVEQGRGSFDLVVRLSSLIPGQRRRFGRSAEHSRSHTGDHDQCRVGHAQKAGDIGDYSLANSGRSQSISTAGRSAMHSAASVGQRAVSSP